VSQHVAVVCLDNGGSRARTGPARASGRKTVSGIAPVTFLMTQ
jgi:hypothetical protein